MKKYINKNKGIALISLVATVVIMMMLMSILLYNVKDSNDVKILMNMYSDIDNLRDKISNYYLTNGSIPTLSKAGLYDIITEKFKADEKDNPIGANDTDEAGKFLIIDLKEIDGLTLNYGRDYEKVKDPSRTSISNTEDDIYIINVDSHNIFYLKGIKVDGHTYYTNQEIDKVPVLIRNN